VNVTVEDLAPCKKLVRIEVDAKEVDETFASVTRDFQKYAALPGFRPGKAPREMVLRKYEKDIEEEVKKKLISDSYRKAMQEHKLDVVGYPDIEEIQFGRGQSLQFAATVETAPEFQLPEYIGLPVRREVRTVTEEDVNRALEALRQQRVSFQTVDRPAQAGDVVVVNYAGTIEGKPIAELAPNARSLGEQKNFWIEIGGGAFIPGFGEQLAGAKAGEKREVTVEFPGDFVNAELAGRKATYEVEVIEVREKVLPALDDAFAQSYGAENMDRLREGVRRDLENELKYTRDTDARMQVMRALLDRVQFDLPETAVARETRNVVYDLVRENQKRGVSREAIEQHKDAIYTAAARNAKERVKAAFLVEKIAEKEKIEVTNEDLLKRVSQLSAMYQIPVQKLLKDLEKRNGFVEIRDQVLNEKVLTFLVEKAHIEEVPPGTLSSQPNPS